MHRLYYSGHREYLNMHIVYVEREADWKSFRLLILFVYCIERYMNFILCMLVYWQRLVNSLRVGDAYMRQ